MALLALIGGPKTGPPAPAAPLAGAWTAFLTGDPAALAGLGDADLAFTFPFRTETLPVLRRAASQDGHWGWDYLHALNLWALDRDEEAASILARLGDEPGYGPFYAARGHLLHAVEGRDPAGDFARAVELAPGIRLLHVTQVRHALASGLWRDALEMSTRGRAAFPGDFNLDLLHVQALLALGRPADAIEILNTTHVLPSENARDSHRLYELAHLAAALDALEAGETDAARRHLEVAMLWPESLGQGRPYDPDERLVHHLLGVVAEREGDGDAARRAFDAAGSVGAEIAAGAGGTAANFFVEQQRRLIARATAVRVGGSHGAGAAAPGGAGPPPGRETRGSSR